MFQLFKLLKCVNIEYKQAIDSTKSPRVGIYEKCY